MTGRPPDLPALHLAAAGGTAPTGCAAPELWHAPGDPIFSLVIDGQGGRPLFELDEAEAGAVLMAWWRHHRARLLDWQATERRRALLALVPGADGG